MYSAVEPIFSANASPIRMPTAGATMSQNPKTSATWKAWRHDSRSAPRMIAVLKLSSPRVMPRRRSSPFMCWSGGGATRRPSESEPNRVAAALRADCQPSVVRLERELVDLAARAADPAHDDRERQDHAGDDEREEDRDAEQAHRDADRQKQRLDARAGEVDLLAGARDFGIEGHQAM